ncbi:MAG: PAS domain S-box protein [Planctomycetales bacterium]|nr:PAS domain S-box protein [Planctomycetales bacterium]
MLRTDRGRPGSPSWDAHDAFARMGWLLKHLPSAAYACDATGQITCCNERAVQLWGREPKLNDPEDRFCGSIRIYSSEGERIPHDRCPMVQVLETGKAQQAEVSFEQPDGQRVAVFVSASPIFDDAGQLLGAVNEMVDISENKRSQEETRKLSEFHETIIRTAAEGICVCFAIPDFPFVQFTVWNDRMTEITGYTIDEINRLGWYQSLYPDPDVQQRAQERMGRMRYGDDLRSEEWEITRKDGERRTVAISTSQVEIESGVEAVAALMQDVTQQKHAQATIEHILDAVAPATGQAFFRSLVDHLCQVCGVDYAVAGAVDWPDPQEVRTIAFSHRGVPLENVTYALHDTPCERVLQETLCFYPTGVQQAFPHDHMLAEFGIDSYMGIPLRSANGEALGLIVLLHNGPFPNPTQARALIQVVAARASAEMERQRAEEELHESRERLRLAVQATQLGPWDLDLCSNEVVFSPEWKAQLGFSDEELSNEYAQWEGRLHPADRQRVLDALHDYLTGKIREYCVEFRLRHRDGSYRWIYTRGVALRDAEGVPIRMLGCHVDITERKRAEEARRELESQMLHSQKLESLGVLAGGIAHDFNNLLTVMLGYASVVRSQLPADSAAAPMVLEIEKAGRRAADLTRQMLAYAGKGKILAQSLHLDRLVQEMSDLLKTAISKKARITSELLPAAIEGDATQIRQVIMNLITNASDALDDRDGEIRIRTGIVHASVEDLSSPYMPEEPPEGEYAYFEVTDDGAGMSEETLTKIFDPFFTTKFAGRGLGLAAVLGIVRGHSGAIQVASEPGRGTTFRVLLPAVAPSVASERPAEHLTGSGQAAGTVLVIDDEPRVRRFAERVLIEAGFSVLKAGDGERGLKLFSAKQAELIAVLVDLTMPKMDGLEVAEQIRRIHATLPIVVMSGYSLDECTERASVIGANGFLQKPFEPHELIDRLSKVVLAPGEDRRS